MSTAVPALVVSFGAVAHAGGLPTGGQVVGGAATINTPSATQMQITSTTSRSAISWNDFSIGAGNSVNVTQPSANSTQLESVRGTNVSQIFGSLTSNGSIVIANPNGIWFGPNAQVDVAGLAAVAASPSAADVQSFMHGGNLNLSQAGNANAAIVNQGNITISNAGLAAFVAPGVRNDGIIQAKLGTVQLSSGTTATLDFYGDGLISIAVSGQTLAQAIDPSTGKPMSAAVGNTGTLNADGGTVLLTANAASNVVNDAINVSGVVQARSVSTQDGMIVLDGGSNGNVQVAATLDASGTGSGQTGGSVKVLGNQVALNAGAKIDVSGDAGGGNVAVGGDFHGAGPDRNAQATYVDANATVDADALTSGNGGQVAVWSDQATTFNGTITARGGSQSGNGGYVETSGRSLVVGHDARVNTTALRGATGTWLLDPENVTIVNSGGSDDTAALSGGTITFTPEGAGSATILASDITADLNTNNVVITTATTPNPDPGQAGDIEVNAAINWGSGSTTLTLNAAHNIDVNAGISSASGSLVMTAANMVTISAPISMSGSVQVHGPVTFSDGAANPLVSTGTGQNYFNAATLAANATLTDSLGELIFSGAVNGPFTLNASGVIFGGTVGINQLIASGATLDNNVTTAGGQTYTDLTLANNITLTDTASGAISFGNVTGSSNSLVIVDDKAPTFSGTVSGLTSVTLAPNTTTATIGVGDSSLTALSGTVQYDFVSTGGLANLVASTATIGIGTTSDSGNITLTQLGAVSHTTLKNLDLTNGGVGAITVSGAYDGTGALSVQAGTGGIALSANVTTGGTQIYAGAGAVTLDVNTTLSNSSGGITFDNPVGGSFVLDVVSGAVTFDSTVNVGQLITQAATLDNNVTTAGGQAYSGAVTLGGSATLTDSTGAAIDFLSTLAGGGNNLTVIDNAAPSFSGTVSNIGTATLAPDTTSDSVGVGDSSKQALIGTVKYDFISTGGLFKLEDGASTIAIGTGSDSGTITATSLTLTPGLVLTNGSTGGIVFSGVVGAGSLLAQSGSGDIALDGGTIVTTGGQTYSGSITLGGDTLLEATASTATVTFGVAENYNSANNLAVLVGGGLDITNSIQNLGTGALSLVAGWDGTAPTSAANVANLISGTHYGSTGGNVVIGSGSQGSTVAVGSESGATTVLGDNVTLNGSSVTNNYLIGPATGAQIGFNYSAGQTAAASGSITVDALGTVLLQSGPNASGFAQIGDGGAGGASSNSVTSLSVTGNITVNAAAITLAAGSGGYAQIGHGGASFGYADNELYLGSINFGGNITVDASGTIALQSSNSGGYAQIGHGGSQAFYSTEFPAGFVTSGSITVGAASLALSAGTVGAGYAQIGHGEDPVSVTYGAPFPSNTSAAGVSGNIDITVSGTLSTSGQNILIGSRAAGTVTTPLFIEARDFGGSFGPSSVKDTAGGQVVVAVTDPAGYTTGGFAASGGNGFALLTVGPLTTTGAVTGDSQLALVGGWDGSTGLPSPPGSSAFDISAVLNGASGTVYGKSGNGVSLGGNVSTSLSTGPAVALAGPVTLTAGVTLAAGTGGNIEVLSTLDSDSNATPRSLTVSGNAVFDGAVGGTHPLGALAVSGTTAIDGGSVATTGGQTYTGAVTLGGNTTLSGSGGGIVFGNTVTGAGDTLAVTQGATTFDNAVTAGVLDLQAVTFDLASGSVSTTAGQTYNGAATLDTNTTLSDSGGGIVFGGAVNGAFALNVTQGATTFSGGVSVGSIATQAVTFDATSGSVATSGGQTYSGAATLGANITLVDSGGNAIQFGSTLAGGVNNLTIIDDTLPVFGGTVSAIGTATLAPFTTTDTIAVGNSTQASLATASISYDFSTGAVATLAAAASTIAIGTGSDTGNITETTLTLTPALVLTNGGAGGITISGALTAGGLTANAGSGGITLDANVTTTAGQTYGGAVTLGATTITLHDSSTAGITFGGTVTGTADTLDVTQGATTFSGAVSLGKLTTEAANIDTSSIATTLGQTYSGAVTLGVDTTLVDTDSVSGGGISFLNTLDSDGTARALTTQTAGTNVSFFTHAVGGSQPLANIDVIGRSDFSFGGLATPVVTTTGAQTYNGLMLFGGVSTTLVSTSGGAIDVLGGTTGNEIFLISTTGTVSLGGTFGSLASLTVDTGPGNLTISASAIVTTGGQVYDHPVVLASSTTLTAGGGVDFADTVDSSGTGATTDGHSLTVSGNATFGGAVGGNFALGSLLVTGTTALNGGTVDTTGSQTYSGAITLGGDTTLDSAAGNGAIHFGSSVNGASDTLTINTGTGGVIFSGFDFNVAGLAIVGPETLDTGTYTLTGGTISNSSGIGLEGNLDLAQATTFASAVTLDADTSIVTTSGSAAITFGSTVNGAHALTTNTAGVTTVSGAVGGGVALASLTVDGPVTLDANVTTAGGQTYSGAITLGGDTLLEATTNTATITFGGVLAYNSADNLAVLSGGAIDVNASIQNAGSGAVSLIAGWDNTAPNSAADVSNLIAGHDYGHNSGNVLIGDGTQTATVAVGSAGGATTVAGAAITLESGTGAAQIGFNVPAGQSGTASGSIGVYATGAVDLTNNGTGFAQIGHGGANAADTGSDNLILSGNITVDAASVTLADGSGTAEYAQIGHGGYGAFGSANVNGGSSGNLSVGGNVTVDATGDVDLIAAGSFTDTYVQIGNGGGLFAGNANPTSFALSGNVTVSSGGTVTVNAGSSVAQIGLGGAGAFNGMSGYGLTGDISIGANTLTLIGNTGGGTSQTAIVGFVGGSSSGSFFGSANGDIDVRVTNTFSTTNGFTFGTDSAVAGSLPIYVQAKALSGFGPNDLAQDTGHGEVVLAITDPGTFNVGTISTGGGNPFALLTEGALNVTGPITNGGDVVLVGGWNGSAGAATFGSGSAFDLSAATGVLSNSADYGNGGKGIAFSADVLSTGGNIALAGPVTLVAGELFTANTTTFYSTVDSSGATPESLSVQGNAVFDGAIGSAHPVGELEVFTGTTTLNGGTVITTGGQIYNNTVTLGANTTLTDSSGSSSAIQFVGTVGDGGNDHALDITQGAVDFGGDVSVGTLSTKAATVAGGGTITTTHGQTYGGAVTLALNTTLNANNNSAITFDSTIDSESGNHALSVSNGSGTTTFSGAVGSGTALSTLTVGAAQLDGGTIITTDGQSYGGISPDRNTTLGADATLINSGGRILFGFDVGGGHNLVINANNATNVLFAAGVGNNSETALASLTVNGSGGTAQFNFDGATTTNGQYYGLPVVLESGNSTAAFSAGTGIVFAGTLADHSGSSAGLVVTSGATVFEGSVDVGSVTTQAVTFDISSGSVSTSGGQTYSGAATLGANTTLTVTTNANITFDDKLDSAASSNHSLTLNSNGGAVEFLAAVGSITPLGNLTVATTLGTTEVEAGVVSTVGAQLYNNTVSISNGNTFDTTGSGANSAGANITFAGSGTSVQDIGNDVTLNAGTGGVITVSGAWSGGVETLLIENSGGATFSGLVAMASGTVSITNTTGTVSFGELIVQHFDTSAGGYAVSITGNGSVFDDNAAPVTFNNSGGVTLGASGATLDFSGGLVSTASTTTLAGNIESDPGGQQYGAVTLDADTTLADNNGGAIGFSGDVNSVSGHNYALTVTTSGQTNFGGSVGNSQALSNLDITAGGATTIAGGTLIETTGDQTYGNPLSLTNSGGITFESINGGTISLPSVIANAGVTVIDLTGTTDLTGSLFTTGGSQVWDTALGLPANDFVFDAQGTTSDITIDAATNLNSGHGLTFLAGHDVDFDAGVQNSGTGAINVVAGWDGSSGLSSGSFSFGDLVGANTTAHQSYGNNGGSVSLDGGSGLIAVGSADGATNVAGGNVVVNGDTGGAQIGYNLGATGTTATGAITVLAADNVTLAGGSGTEAFAQIGHGGELVDTNVNLGAVTLGGDIDVSADGNIVLQGGSGDYRAGHGAYAQIGHGGLGFLANTGASDTTIGAVSITGDITVTSTSGTVSLGGGDQWAYAQIGHGGMAFAENQTSSSNEILARVTLSGNITVGAAGDISLTGGTAADDAFDAYAQIGHGGDAALSLVTVTGTTTVGGAISVMSSSGSASLGGNDDYAYAQIGHGGLTFGILGTFAGANVGGDVTVEGATGVSVTGGAGSTAPGNTNTGAYAQIGNGGEAMLYGASAGAMMLDGATTVSVGNSGGVTLTGGSATGNTSNGVSTGDSYAQIGLGGDDAFGGANLASLTVGSATSTIGVSAGGAVSLAGGSGSNDYAQIGDGGVQFASGAIISGAVSITGDIGVASSSGTASVGGGTGGEAYAQIGHGGDQALSNANATSVSLGGTIGVTADGDITVAGGSSTSTTDNYAQIGHGGLEFAANTGPNDTALGDVSATGDITVTSTGTSGTISLGGGSDQSDYVQIGHGGLGFAANLSGSSNNNETLTSATLSGNITVGASGNISLTGGSGGGSADAFDAYAQIGHGGDSALSDTGNALTVSGTTTVGGSISVVSSSGSISLGGGDDYAYAQIGHGGLTFGTFGTFADVSVTGDITVEGATGVNVTGGAGSTYGGVNYYTNTGAYAQIGNGGEAILSGAGAGAVTLGGAIAVDGGSGGVSLTGGSATGNLSNGVSTGDSYAQIGLGGDSAFIYANFGSLTVGGAADTIGVSTGGAVALNGGSGGGDYAQVGDGGFQFASYSTVGTTTGTVFTSGGVTLSGDITVGAASVTLAGDPGSNGTFAYVQIGHGGGAALYNATAGDVTVGGDISVTGSSGDISLTGGSGDAAYAQIGHGGAYFGSAYNFVDSGGTTILTGTGATFGSVTLDGNIIVATTHSGGTSGGAFLTGGSNAGAYAQIGHGGSYAFSGDSSGTNGGSAGVNSLTLGGVGETIAVTADNGITLSAGTSTGAYAQIGHGGYSFAYGVNITNAMAVASAIDVTANSGDIDVTGAGFEAYAQIGHGGLGMLGGYTFASVGSLSVAGDISVMASDGNISISSTSGGYAQIGDLGKDFASSAQITGAATIDGDVTVGATNTLGTSGGVTLTGDAGGGGYAQIGHGGLDAFEDAGASSLGVSGGITVTADDGVSVNGGSGFDAYAQIGHGGADFARSATVGTTAGTVFTSGGVTLSGDITVGAASVTLSGGSNNFGYAQIGHGGGAALYNATAGDVWIGGDVSVTASDGDISLTGGSGEATYAQIGHGGAYFGSADNVVVNPTTTILIGTGATFGSVTLDGNITVEATNSGGTSGGVFLTGGADSDAYAQIGHGGSYAFAGANCGCNGGPITLASLTLGGASEAITVTADQDISLTGGSSDGAYVQIGHGGYGFASGATVTNAITVESDITVTTGNGYNFSAGGGRSDGAYMQIGHGGYAFAAGSSFGRAAIGGNIDVTVPDGLAFVISGTNTYAYAQIGHGGAEAFAFTGTTVSPTYGGTVSVNSDDLAVGSFSPVAYGVIGSGDPLPAFAGGTGTLSGTVDVTTVGDQDYLVGFADVILAGGTYSTSNGTISFSDGFVGGIAPVVLSGSITVENSTTVWGQVTVANGVTAPNMIFALSGQDTTFTDAAGSAISPIGTLSVSGGSNFTIVTPAVVTVDTFVDQHMTGTVDFGHTLNVLDKAFLGDPFTGDLVCASGGTSCVVGIDGFSLALNFDFQDQTLHLFDIQYALSNPGLNLLAGGGINPQAGCTEEEKQANGGSCPAGSGDNTGFGNQFLSGTKP